MNVIGNSILDQFNLPQVAVDSIKAQKLKMTGDSDGVSHLSAEHSGGLPYRFFTFADYDNFGSKIAKYEKFNNVDCIEWTIDSKNKYPARLADLPKDLIEFEIIGYKEVPASLNPNLVNDPYAHPVYSDDCIGGLLRDAYLRFKEGLTAPGLPISKWGVLSDAEVATLAKYGLFSVEQFAAKPRSWIMNGRFPKSMQDAFERAVFYVNGQAGREKDAEIAEKLKALVTESNQKDQMIAEMNERMKMLEERFSRPAEVNVSAVGHDVAPKRRGRPRVIKESNE